MVLANGQIANVNQQSNPDLYFALRGGGNNFGIVTRFDLETFSQGKMCEWIRSLPCLYLDTLFLNISVSYESTELTLIIFRGRHDGTSH